MSNSSAIDLPNMEHAEHLVLETGIHERIELDHEARPEEGKLTVKKSFEIKDGFRQVHTKFVLYEQGVLKLEEIRRKRRKKFHRLHLRYLDPVPSIDTQTAKRVWYAAFGCGGFAAACALLTQFAVLRPFVLPLAVVGGAACIGALALAAYMTRQRIVYYTLHGRSPAIRLKAGFGYRRRMRAILPALSAAIEDAAESIGDETATFLREEMREHYRLRSDGILTPQDCDDGTGRILAQFDGPL